MTSVRMRHNLPVPLTTLIGRTDELTAITDRLVDARVVTLTGSGGVGKTRLALAVATESMSRYPGGIWWVELAPLSNAAAVGPAALAVLDARQLPGVTAEQQLVAELGEQPSLLVLDNCEHVRARCAELVAGLLAANGSVTVLTTSREPIGVPGEVTWRVPSLTYPAVDSILDHMTMSRFAAVELFVDRARRARSTFELRAVDAPAIAQICHRLDGIPLAIELAAARCGQLPVARIATELDDRFRFLTGGPSTALPRQQTLAASVDWSHDSLDESERTTFQRLGAFAGPFPLEAAEAVAAAGDGLDRAEIFDLLRRLVDKSLVVADIGATGETRYRLLESIRAYALDRAVAAGEQEAISDAHLAWWSDWLEPRAAMPSDDDLAEVEEFHDNLRAALDWSARYPPTGLRVLGLLARPWTALGKSSDALTAADSLLTAGNAALCPDDWLTAANETADLHLWARGEAAFLSLLERIEAVATLVGDEFHTSISRMQHSPDPADAIVARDLARERGDRYREAMATINLAEILGDDDPNVAHPAVVGAAEIASCSSSRHLRLLAHMAQVTAARACGDLRRCLDLGRALLPQSARISPGGLVTEMSAAALLANDLPTLRAVVEAADRVERISPGIGMWAVNARHRLDLITGDDSSSQWLLREPDARWPLTTATMWLLGRESIDAGETNAAVAGVRDWATLSPASPHARAVIAAVEAAATNDEDRWHDALVDAVDHGFRLIAVDALEGIAGAAARAENWGEGERLLAAAQRLRDETGYRWRFGFEQRAVDAAHTAALDALGAEGPACAAQGNELDWHEAAEYARRARGERKRPRYGWASITPTEHHVIELVAEGLSNPQIAEKLFMGRATVKSHLDHVFAKLGMRSRAQIAAEVARRSSTPTRDNNDI